MAVCIGSISNILQPDRTPVKGARAHLFCHAVDHREFAVIRFNFNGDCFGYRFRCHFRGFFFDLTFDLCCGREILALLVHVHQRVAADACDCEAGSSSCDASHNADRRLACNCILFHTFLIYHFLL